MKKIEEALWSDYNDVSNLIKGIDTKQTDLYKATLEERDKIRNEMIKLKQIQQEKNMSDSKIESENIRDKVRNRITLITFSITTIVSVYAMIRTFKFDQGSTVTSTLGRGILNGFIPKLSKR